MTGAEVLDGLKTVIEEAFPGVRVYTAREETDFQRPAFLLQAGKLERTALTAAHWQMAMEATVTAFEAVDAYHNSRPEALLERLDGLFARFGPPAVPLGGRWAEVLARKGDYGLDYAELTLKLRWTEAAEAGQGGEVPVMEEFQFHLEKKE